MYFDVLKYSINKQIVIESPNIIDIEISCIDDKNDLDLPEWLRDTSIKKVEKSKIDKVLLEDM
ncbi:MAG: hypothetical protein Q8S84_01320 [bacterium]|nr:hypothetical protein [bacterium]MDP3380213.1 hypothetical protein [bacterium]